jgi:hypothetical protein
MQCQTQSRNGDEDEEKKEIPHAAHTMLPVCERRSVGSALGSSDNRLQRVEVVTLLRDNCRPRVAKFDELLCLDWVPGQDKGW